MCQNAHEYWLICSFLDRLFGWLVSCSADWLVDHLVGWSGLLIGRMVSWLASWFIGLTAWLVDWLDGWSVCLVVWSAAWFIDGFGWLICWPVLSARWLIDRQVYWLFNGLVDWLVDWPNFLRRFLLSCPNPTTKSTSKFRRVWSYQTSLCKTCRSGRL